MMGNNMFYGEKRKIILELSLLPFLIWSTDCLVVDSAVMFRKRFEEDLWFLQEKIFEYLLELPDKAMRMTNEESLSLT